MYISGVFIYIKIKISNITYELWNYTIVPYIFEVFLGGFGGLRGW